MILVLEEIGLEKELRRFACRFVKLFETAGIKLGCSLLQVQDLRDEWVKACCLLPQNNHFIVKCIEGILLLGLLKIFFTAIFTARFILISTQLRYLVNHNNLEIYFD